MFSFSCSFQACLFLPFSSFSLLSDAAVEAGIRIPKEEIFFEDIFDRIFLDRIDQHLQTQAAFIYDYPLELAVLAVVAREALELIAAEHVERAREFDELTWEQVGERFGTSMQSAHSRFRRRS